MYHLIKNQQEMNQFNAIFKECFVEKGYETETFQGKALRYLIHNKYGKNAGTLELIPYAPKSGLTTIEDMFAFSTLPQLKEISHDRVYEIDKLAVLETERKNGTLDNMMGTIFRVAKEMNIDMYVALINPMLFRAVKMVYRMPIEKCGKIIRTEHYDIQPMIFHVKKALEDPSWDTQGYLKKWLYEDK